MPNLATSGSPSDQDPSETGFAAASSQDGRGDRHALAAADGVDDGPARRLFRLLSLLEPEPLDWEQFSLLFEQRAARKVLQISDHVLRKILTSLDWCFELIEEHPYALPLYNVTAEICLLLGYPDLAAGAAYKALLLADAVREDSDEYHEEAMASLRRAVGREQLERRTEVLASGLGRRLQPGADSEPGIPGDRLPEDEDVITWLDASYGPATYRLLASSLLSCGCLQSAAVYADQGLSLAPEDAELQDLRRAIFASAAKRFGVTPDALVGSEHGSSTTWSDDGWVRRERYPWNTYEPDRLMAVENLNEMMLEVAPKLEVKAVQLPALTRHQDPTGESVVTQLGVFAKEDLQPGEVVLDETSLLTANNKLQDALCDACSADLPDLNGEAGEKVVACETCEVVFCSQTCYDMALESYHPALCEREVDAISKDVPPSQAADSLYSLLLLRALAMAETQDCHPLDLKEIKYIWADFHDLDLNEHGRTPSPHDPASAFAGFPRTLPFSFEYNIRLPFHMLEKMDVDIFANPRYDVWVFNTLYAKFRGTASARLSGLGGRAIRGPEVCAVHPMWCLANHSCDPNVGWEWGGSVKFHVREKRVAWQAAAGGNEVQSSPGIRRGEEVLNHYCDLDLPVDERRAWARGALGGDCLCRRCVWEAQQAQG